MGIPAPVRALLPLSLVYAVNVFQSSGSSTAQFCSLSIDAFIVLPYKLRCHNLIKVEELAWLVRGNLHAKHLVLSFEELFAEFLECPLSEEEEGILALEPMQSHQLMLLHQLADLFGLAHESIGEGEERHLVVEKCEDSSIPVVLVSDVLLNDDRDTQSPLSSKQVLKRDTTPRDGSPTPFASNTTALSLEERQAAYLAARERIFSATWKSGEESTKATGLVRPRSDPVVARRMIAHALGKSKVLPFPSPTTGLICPEDPQVWMKEFPQRVARTVHEINQGVYLSSSRNQCSSLQL